ncbi:hypothetical protein [Nostoc piscinale]|nr:hypothetical protein [Nostoc piscinale]
MLIKLNQVVCAELTKIDFAIAFSINGVTEIESAIAYQCVV